MNDIKRTSEYNLILDLINKIKPNKTNPIAIERFSESIYNSILGISKDSINECISYFLNDFFKEDVEFTVEVFLQGIIVESESLDLGNGMNLRQVFKEDFEEKILHHFSGMELIGNVDACIEFKARLNLKDINKNISNQISSQILKLSFLANGAIRQVIEFSKFYSLRYGGRGVISLVDKNWYGFEKFLLKKENETDFVKILKRINPPQKLILNEEKIIDELTIAYNHYVESYLNNYNIDKRIAQNIMGLEALFSDENSSDLKFKLSNRIARLSWYFGYDNPVLLRNFIKIAYDIRSRFAHGGQYTKKDYAKIEKKFWEEKEFLYRLHKILAKSILLFSSEGISKNSLIDEIDNSFIDNNFFELISNKIKNLPISYMDNKD